MAETEAAPRWRLERARSGKLALVRPDGTWAESRYAPEADAARRAEDAEIEEGDKVLLLGVGGGELPRAILARCGPTGRLIVAEPEEGIVEAFLGYSATTDLFADERFSLLVLASRRFSHSAVEAGRVEICRDERSFLDRVGQLNDLDRVLIHPSLSLPNSLAHLRGRLEDLEVRRRSAKRFADVLDENVARNLSILHTSPGVIELSGLLQGKDVLVAGGGASLASIARQVGNDADWIAVGRALQTLAVIGVQPHVAVLTDPQDEVCDQIEGLEPETLPPLVFFSTTAHRAVAMFPHRIAAFAEGDGGRRMAPLRAEIGELPARGSVVLTAIGLAGLLGAKRIFLAGVDLAEPDGLSHTKGGVAEVLRVRRTGRFDSIEEQMLRRERTLAATGDRVELPAAGGGMIPSRRNLALYARALEDLVMRMREVEFIQLADRSAALSGVRLGTPGEIHSGRSLISVPTGQRVRQNVGRRCK